MIKKIENGANITLAIATIIALCLMFSKCEAQTVRECVIQSYTSEIGVREATGHNDGDQVEKYLSSVGLPKGYAWCAAFVNYNLRKCGAQHAGSGWSPNWFPLHRTVVTRLGLGDAGYEPRAGDVFGIFFLDKKRIAHIGFIHVWGRNNVVTVEGNTNNMGSREGDGVYKKTRLKNQIYAVANWIDL